jgi:glucose/arabinose dehydrogenase
MDNARMFWVPSISPSSIMFYTGDKFPRWKNNLFVGALTTQQLIRVAFGKPSQAERPRGPAHPTARAASATCSRVLTAISMSRQKDRVAAMHPTEWC